MNIDIIQAAIAVLGASSIWLLGRRDARLRRWGYVLGLASQPFWVFATWQAHQHGMFLLSLFYCWAWTAGIYNHWGADE